MKLLSHPMVEMAVRFVTDEKAQVRSGRDRRKNNCGGAGIASCDGKLGTPAEALDAKEQAGAAA